MDPRKLDDLTKTNIGQIDEDEDEFYCKKCRQRFTSRYEVIWQVRKEEFKIKYRCTSCFRKLLEPRFQYSQPLL